MEKQKLFLGMILGRIKREMIRVLKKRFSEQTEIELTLEQYGLLRALNSEEDNVIQKNMAETMGKDKSAVLRLIDSLEKKGLVRRVIDINDRRKNYLIVTKKGERLLEKYSEIESGLIDKLEQGLTKTEIDIFYKVLNQIKNNAEKL
jgi:MarR family transcriptional regulator for hemolysin